MSTASFAEILREKLQNTQGKTRFSAENDTISQAKMSTDESIELLKLKTRLLESSPHAFISTHPKMNETPYHRFQTKREYNSSANGWAKKGQTSPLQTSSTPKARIKGLPHKLTEIQTASMTYFIQKREFLLEDFTIDELKKSYRKLALVFHPDRSNGSTVSFLELKKHYEVLCSVFKK